MTDRIAAWEDGDWANFAARKELCHTLAEDIRRRLWIAFFGKYATADNTSEPSGTYGEESQAGWWGDNGPFREGGLGAFADYGTTGLDDENQNYGPGAFAVWFDESWGPYSIVGMTTNYGGSGKDEVWVQDATVQGSETRDGNMLAECPLQIAGVTTATETNGYWRIKSKRTSNVSGTDYVLLELEDMHGDSDLTLLSDYGSPASSYSCGGTVECDFGGDRYTFCPTTFKTEAQCIHQYADNARGDADLRPPDGGRYSADRNSYWIRTVNPNRYHHYDVNAHRWICQSERSDTTFYQSIIPSYKFLPFQADPKEQVPPCWYADTGRLAWRIAGNKVAIAAEQLTAHDQSYAAQGASVNLDDYNVVRTNTLTYRTVSVISSGLFMESTPEPPMPDDSDNTQRADWKETKWDTTSLWPWLEMYFRQMAFVMAVNSVYQTNWMEANRHVTDPVTLAGDPAGTTYGDKWYSGGVWDLSGYRPRYNSSQKEYALLTDDHWGENGSGVEKALSDLGEYDWWYDTSKTWIPDGGTNRILKMWGEIKYGLEYNCNDETGTEAAADWELPRPNGTWRKVPMYSFGVKDSTKMRAYEEGAPAGESFRDAQHGGAGGCTTNYWWPGIYRQTAPASFSTYEGALAARHEPIHTHDSTDYWEKAFLILSTIRRLMDQYTYLQFTGPTSVLLENTTGWPSDWSDDSDTDVAALHARINVLQWAVDEDPATWSQTGVSPALLGRNGTYLRDTDVDSEFHVEAVTCETRVALKFSDFPNVPGYISGFCRLRIASRQSMCSTPDEEWDHAVIDGLGDDPVTQAEDDSIYEYIRIEDMYVSDDSVLYWELKLLNVTTLWIRDEYDTITRYVAGAHAPIYKTTHSDNLIAEFDFDAYADAIWQRDDTYAKLLPQDPAEDEDPPVHEPTEFFCAPVIYDANRPEYDYSAECYTWDWYVAEWRIKGESILMEDLEGNGVYYKFCDSSGNNPITEAAANWQATRTFDDILDRDVAASPGDEDDLLDAIDDGLDEWEYEVRVRDNASAAGAGQTDNECTASDPALVSADTACIVPPVATWASEPSVDPITGDVELTARPAIGAADDRDCEYYFSRAGWNSGWQDSNVAVDESPSLPQTYTCVARTKVNQIEQYLSEEVTVNPV